MFRKHQNEQQTETRQVHRTDLCGTPQANTAVKEMRKIKSETDGKIKAQPSSPDPDLSGVVADFRIHNRRFIYAARETRQ